MLTFDEWPLCELAWWFSWSELVARDVYKRERAAGYSDGLEVGAIDLGGEG